VITDNGRQFVSDKFKQYPKIDEHWTPKYVKNNCKKYQSGPFNNDLAKRETRSQELGQVFDEDLFRESYAKLSSTGFTPAYFNNWREPTHPEASLRQEDQDWECDLET
jgi:hypothetical protein